MHTPPPLVAAPPCTVVARDAFAFLDGALDAPSYAAVASHVARCPTCRGRVARDRRFLGALRRTARATPAPARLREHAHARFAGWWAAH